MLTIKVEEGKITSLVFDPMNREGNIKLPVNCRGICYD